MQDISLDDIDLGGRNSRINYSQASIERMAQSMSVHGQLASVKVRPSQKKPGEYEVIYGHRRVLAAKRLGWKVIRAEVSNSDDQRVMWESLVENLEREDLTDYEKAIFFERFHSEFGKTYGEIGGMVGLSTQQISNYVGMCRLFEKGFLAENPDVVVDLHGVTEHQARAVSRVTDQRARANLLRMVRTQNLSVRDIENVVTKLRAWFADGAPPRLADDPLFKRELADEFVNQESEDIQRIRDVIHSKFRLAQTRDFSSFEKLYLFGKGYTIFPFLDRELLEEEDAILFKKSWIHSFMPHVSWSIQQIKVRMMAEDAAVAMVRMSYQNKENPKQEIKLRGTMVLVRRTARWRIFHEHWSMPESNHPLGDFSKQNVGRQKATNARGKYGELTRPSITER